MWRSVVVIPLLALLLPLAVTAGDELLRFYEYDKSAPLNAKLSVVEEREHFTLYKVYYTSVNNVRVPALLIVPRVSRPPYPCVIFLHGYGGRKEDAILLAEVAARFGYAIFSIDAEYHGERRVPGKQLYSPDPEDSRRAIVQTIIDLRRGVDFLETLEYIDRGRIGYAGGSMGAILGAIFIGVEPRVRAAVLVVGGGNMTLMIRESEHPAIPPIRERIEREGISWEEVKRLLEPVEPLNFIWRFSPRPVQFHCGRYDRVVPAEAQRQLAERAGEPKEVYWYDTGHNVPLEEVALRAIEFFNRHLKEGDLWDRVFLSLALFSLQLARNLPYVLLIAASAAAGAAAAYLKHRRPSRRA